MIQQYLSHAVRDGRGQELQKVSECIFLSTPTNGSELLLSLRKGLSFFRLWRNIQEEGLRPLNDRISEIQRDLVTRVMYAAAPDNHACPVKMTAYVGQEDGVVSPQSAHWVFRNCGTLPGTHSTIIQPVTAEDPIVGVVTRALERAPYSAVFDEETIATRFLDPWDVELLHAGVALQRSAFPASLSASLDDIEYWLRHYRETFKIDLRVMVGLYNDKVCGFMMFHEDPRKHLIVVDYFAVNEAGALNHRLSMKMVDRLKQAAERADITKVIFEVAQDGKSRGKAVVRLFERLGARCVSEIAYSALDMERFPAPGSTKPYYLMFASVGPAPESLPRAEVEELVRYMYLTWYRNWISRSWQGREGLQTSLEEQWQSVFKDLPAGTTHIRLTSIWQTLDDD